MSRILIVDDDAARRSGTAQAIRAVDDMQTDECADGAAARACLVARSYDVLLVDVRMPGESAIDLCRQLRAEPATRDLPVLFLAPASLPMPPAWTAEELGPVDVIVEPLVAELLSARIRFAARLKTLADPVRLPGTAVQSAARGRMDSADALATDTRAERDDLREAFEALDEAVVLLGASTEVVVANAAGRRLMGSTLEAALRAWSAAAAPRPAVVQPERVTTPSVPESVREFVQGTRVLLGRVYPSSGGRMLLCLRDVTEARVVEVKRLQAEKLAAMGILAAGVAHEINNSAAFVVANFEALSTQIRALDQRVGQIADSDLEAKMSGLLFETISILQESKEGMARIQRTVRDLSSLAPVDDVYVGPIEINATVDSTLLILRSELRHRALVDRDLRATRRVCSTSARLGQVFLNLIMNAVQALDETRAKDNRIRVRTYDSGNDVIFEVTDNGAGIAPGVLPRVFDSFFTTKPRGTGAGLGLPISQGIVRSLGGEITVETELGGGSEFRVRFPSEPAAVAARPVEADLLAQSPPTAAPSQGPRPYRQATLEYRRRRVLAVDDEALLLKAYRRMIGDVHEVVTALGGRDAMLVLRRGHDFDLILCDLQMPEMSGIELYMTAKKEFPVLADRFVFVTGGAFSSEARQFLEQAVTCLNKPFTIEELMALIDEKTADRVALPVMEAPPDEGPQRRIWTSGSSAAVAPGNGSEGKPAQGLRNPRPRH
jgi:signal transduction histidine kinase